ncbi:unnamed protein product [Taenia asiatica]|uniref:LITAF domain-containing protein n=1 Tax=Taenia asiatica TaxID=60517 RepID=A0A0R3WFZ4_TAEAS|nr:unnamed protein product [Taenia asiatica]
MDRDLQCLSISYNIHIRNPYILTVAPPAIHHPTPTVDNKHNGKSGTIKRPHRQSPQLNQPLTHWAHSPASHNATLGTAPGDRATSTAPSSSSLTMAQANFRGYGRMRQPPHVPVSSKLNANPKTRKQDFCQRCGPKATTVTEQSFLHMTTSLVSTGAWQACEDGKSSRSP